MDSYLTLYGAGSREFTEKRSRFIGQARPVSCEQEALEHIKTVKEENPGARHYPFAYIIRGQGIMRYSDDGEPQGTGGMPILDVFRKEEITDFCCVVTRYFGGVLLGAPGLTRAYAKGAKLGLEAAGVLRMSPRREFRAACPYRLLETVRRELERLSAAETGAEYAQEVILSGHIKEEGFSALCTWILDLTAGTVRLKPGDVRYMGTKIK